MIAHVKKGIKKFWAFVALLSIDLIIVIISFFSALTVFVTIAKMVFLDKRNSFDSHVFTFLTSHVSTVNTTIMQFFSFLGSHYFLIPANFVLVLYFFAVKKQPWFSIKIPVISLSSLFLMFALKHFFHRERPLIPLVEKAHGLSFPSGHALMSFAFYGLLIFIAWQNFNNKPARFIVTVLFLLVIFMIGLSRIYLRVHYATDVIAGFSLGLIWLVLSLFILNKIEAISSKEIDPVVQK